jgi:CubicO group peptidase (beta-lactamase class C family)
VSSRKAVVRKAGQFGPTPRPLLPGGRCSYSNVGYVVAAAVAERAAAATWEDLMAEQVFGPLGMSSAGLGRDRPHSDLLHFNPSEVIPEILKVEVRECVKRTGHEALMAWRVS